MEVTKKCGAKDYATNLGLIPEDDDIPLYLHPAKELPTKEDEYWLMVEVLRAKVKEQQAEILAGKIMIKGYGKTIDEQHR